MTLLPLLVVDVMDVRPVEPSFQLQTDPAVDLLRYLLHPAREASREATLVLQVSPLAAETSDCA